MFKSPRRYLHIQQFYRNCSSSDVNQEQASGRLNQLPPSNWTLNGVSHRDSLTEKRKAHNLEITRSKLVRGISFFSPLSFYGIKNTYLSLSTFFSTPILSSSSYTSPEYPSTPPLHFHLLSTTTHHSYPSLITDLYRLFY